MVGLIAVLSRYGGSRATHERNTGNAHRTPFHGDAREVRRGGADVHRGHRHGMDGVAASTSPTTTNTTLFAKLLLFLESLGFFELTLEFLVAGVVTTALPLSLKQQNETKVNIDRYQRGFPEP